MDLFSRRNKQAFSFIRHLRVQMDDKQILIPLIWPWLTLNEKCHFNPTRLQRRMHAARCGGRHRLRSVKRTAVVAAIWSDTFQLHLMVSAPCTKLKCSIIFHGPEQAPCLLSGKYFYANKNRERENDWRSCRRPCSCYCCWAGGCQLWNVDPPHNQVPCRTLTQLWNFVYKPQLLLQNQWIGIFSCWGSHSSSRKDLSSEA